MNMFMQRICPLFFTVTALGLLVSPVHAKIGLKAIGDEKNGYGVQILFNAAPIAHHNDGGEFSAVVENGDRSYFQRIKNWKASSCKVEGDRIELTGTATLPNLIANLDVTIIYRVINENLVKKQIILKQCNANKLFYSLENRLQPVEKPQSFWSFDQENCRGGSLLEIYPAAGFRLNNGLACGLLTDAGYRNLWTRNVRKRNVIGPFDTSGHTAVQIIPDHDLYRVATKTERKAGKNYVALNFGQVHNFNYGKTTAVKLPGHKKWASLEGGKVEKFKEEAGKGPYFTISGSANKNELNGIVIPIPVKPGLFYNVNFKYRTDIPAISTRLWEEKETRDISLYNDQLQGSKTTWKEFKQQFYVFNTKSEKDIYRLVLSRGYAVPKGLYRIEIKELKVIEKHPVVECYHPLNMGEASIKTMFIFVEPAKTLREYRLASQLRLAEGLDFKGTEAEKIFYADLNMLTWISDHKDLTPHLVPSLIYSPEMYNRDSFWSAMGFYDRKLSEALWNKWAATQNDEGCIGTIVTPFVGSEENTPNDATLCFILWAYVNRKRYDSPIVLDKIEKALNYCRKSFTRDKNGRILATTPLCQMDVMWSHDKKQLYAVNQGFYAVILKCAKELGCKVTDAEIKSAIKSYRSFYDKKRGYIVSWSERPDIIALYDLMPEFLSWWFWNKPILSAEEVINTLEKFPLYRDCMPIMCKSDGTFFNKKDHPFDQPEIRWEAGIYYNGGSWLRVEYMAYVVALKHGWKKAKQRMKKRLFAEFNNKPDEPVSHEWMPCTPGVEWNMSRVFAWNVFILMANEVAGLRKPEQSPGYRKK
ncbi:hypothetical protein ACFL35_03615 [Candidatus Riflebacteria bacterium]